MSTFPTVSGSRSPTTTATNSGTRSSTVSSTASPSASYAPVPSTDPRLIQDGYCFGQNSRGEVGSDKTQFINTVYYPSYPICNDLELVQVTVDTGHTCGLDRFNHAWCWGSNSRGQVGTLDAPSKVYCPLPVQAFNMSGSEIEFLQVVVGNSFTLAIDVNRNLYGWGDNSRCNLGIGGTVAGNNCNPPSPGYSLVPVLAITPFKFLQIAAGEYHGCGITLDMQLVCWGGNPNGQVSKPKDWMGTEITEYGKFGGVLYSLHFVLFSLGSSHGFHNIVGYR